MSNHWQHPGSRCPECGYKQGDIDPEIQPVRLSKQIDDLQAKLAAAEQRADALEALVREAVPLVGICHGYDWHKSAKKLLG